MKCLIRDSGESQSRILILGVVHLLSGGCLNFSLTEVVGEKAVARGGAVSRDVVFVNFYFTPEYFNIVIKSDGRAG